MTHWWQDACFEGVDFIDGRSALAWGSRLHWDFDMTKIQMKFLLPRIADAMSEVERHDLRVMSMTVGRQPGMVVVSVYPEMPDNTEVAQGVLRTFGDDHIFVNYPVEDCHHCPGFADFAGQGYCHEGHCPEVVVRNIMES